MVLTCSIQSSIAGRRFSSTFEAATAFLELVPVRRSALAPDVSPDAPPDAFFTRKGAYAPEEEGERGYVLGPGDDPPTPCVVTQSSKYSKLEVLFLRGNRCAGASRKRPGYN